MNAPTTAAFRLRRKLSTLATRGSTQHERSSAAAKLAQLEKRYDFTQPDPEEAEMIFAVHITPSPDNLQCVATFPGSDRATGDFVKWALANAYHLQTVWRGPDLLAGVARESIAALREIADTIRTTFAALCRQFHELPGATPEDTRLFLLGLYDGMMNDDRKAGQMLPARTRRTVPRTKAKRRALAVAPGLSIHPYSVALDLGRRIRMKEPADILTRDLSAMEERARLTV